MDIPRKNCSIVEGAGDVEMLVISRVYSWVRPDRNEEFVRFESESAHKLGTAPMIAYV